jgi:proteic killer suppression protein
VDVYYLEHKLADVCASERAMTRAFGHIRAKRLGMRLQQLRVAETLHDLTFVTNRCHELIGDHAGTLALDLDGPYRLLFEPVTWITNSQGRLDWSAVKAVVIIGIIDYH